METAVAFTDEFMTGSPHNEYPMGFGLDESDTYATRIYAVYCDSMGGFPGLWQLCILAAHAFNEVHKDVDWGEYNFKEVIDIYVHIIDEYVLCHGTEDPDRFADTADPIGDMADAFPLLAKEALESFIHKEKVSQELSNGNTGQSN